MALHKKAGELRKGDVTELYTVLNVVYFFNTVIAEVKSHDGEVSERIFEDAEMQIPILEKN
jgi:hypothetical protein